MNDRKRNHRGELIIGTCLLLLTFAAQRPAFAADSGATANLNLSSDNGLSVSAQGSANANIAGANVNILLGGNVSGNANRNPGENGSDTSANARAMVRGSGEFGFNHGRNGEIHGKANVESDNQIGSGPDGGTVPVPEPGTWVALGTLLSILGVITMTTRRKAGSQA